MMKGNFKHKVELGILAVLVVAGGWNINALAYLVVMAFLAMASAVILDVLLQAASKPSDNACHASLHESNPWLVTALAVFTVAVPPSLIIAEFAPPIVLVIYALFFSHYAAALVREFLNMRRQSPRAKQIHAGLDASPHLP